MGNGQFLKSCKCTENTIGKSSNCDFVSGISYVKPTVTFEARLCFLIFREENFHPFSFELNHFLVK